MQQRDLFVAMILAAGRVDGIDKQRQDDQHPFTKFLTTTAETYLHIIGLPEPITSTLGVSAGPPKYRTASDLPQVPTAPVRTTKGPADVSPRRVFEFRTKGTTLTRRKSWRSRFAPLDVCWTFRTSQEPANRIPLEVPETTRYVPPRFRNGRNRRGICQRRGPHGFADPTRCKSNTQYHRHLMAFSTNTLHLLGCRHP